MSKKERTWRSGVTTQWPLDNGLESGKITANSFLSMMSFLVSHCCILSCYSIKPRVREIRLGFALAQREYSY
jgi:hypothetical protein